MKTFCFNICISGISSGEHNIYGHWRPTLGRCRPWFPCAACFDIHDSQAAKATSAYRDKLVDIFNRIERFFYRLEIYTGITPTMAMREMITEIMVEVLMILAIATKEVKRGQLSELMSRRFMIIRLTGYLEKYMKKLIGNTEIEDSLNRLDRLTLEEALMASAELLKVTHGVDGKVMVVDDRVKGVEGKVQDVHSDVQDVARDVQSVEGRVQDVLSDVQDVGGKVQGIEGGVQDILCDVQDVGHKVQTVEGKVQDVRDDVQDVGDNVQHVDDRLQGIGSDVKDISSDVREVDIILDQVASSLSRYHLLTVPSAQTYSQGSSSEIVFYDGFRPQIHLSIITSHPKPITTAQLNGSFKAVYSMNGNPPTLLCGYTESVRFLLAFII